MYKAMPVPIMVSTPNVAKKIINIITFHKYSYHKDKFLIVYIE